MSAISQHPISWDDLRVLLALCRAGTYKGAATRLGVAGSTIGRRLEALELALGSRLFDRTPDGVRPTAAAERLLPRAEQVELAVTSLLRVVDNFESQPEGVVRITAPPGVVDAFVAPSLPKLLEAYPSLRIELESSVAYADLTRGEADLALRAIRPTTGDLVSVRVAEERDTLFASASRVKAWGALKSFEGIPFIGYGESLAHIPTARWVQQVTRPTQLVLKSNSVGAQLAAAESGLGALLLPAAFARVSSLVEVKLRPSFRKSLPPPPIQQLYLVGHRAMRSVPRVAVVWEFLLEAFAFAGVDPGSSSLAGSKG